MPGVRIRLSADEADAALARFRQNLQATGATAKKTESEIKSLEQKMLSNAGVVKQKRAFEDMAKMMGLTQREAQKLGKELGGIGGGVNVGLAEMTGGVKGLGMAFMKVSLAIAGVAMSFRAFVLPSLTYLGKMETATLGIGTSLMMNNSYIDKNTKQVLQGTQALDAAIGHSEKVMNDLRIANLETTATLEQLVDAFQVTLPVAMAKGFNVKQAEDFTVAMVKAAGAIGLPFEQLGEETRSLLTENINPRNSRIATVLGLRNEDVRKYKDDAEGLFKFLMEKLQVYEVAGARSAKTWAGLWSNLKDIIQQVLGQAFEPLFIEVKRWLTDTTNGLFKVVTVTNELGEEVKKIEWNKDLVKGVNAFRDALETTIGWAHKLQMILSGMGEIVSNLMSGVWALSETFWQIYNIPFFGTSDLGNAGLKAARSARIESQENAKRYRQARVEGEKYFADKAMGKQNFSPISDEEAISLFDYGARPDGVMTSEIDPNKKWYYRVNPPERKTTAVPNPKKPGGEEGGGGGANEGHRLEDLRLGLEKEMEKIGKDEYGLLDLQEKQILADFAPKGKKGVRGAVSQADIDLIAKWKKAKLGEIDEKEQKILEDNLQKRREEIQKEYEEEVTLRQGLADEEFKIAQDLEQSQVDLDVEKRILTERDALIKKQDAAVKANQQEQDALINKMNSLPVDDERLKKMTQELILLDAKGKALQKANKIETESYDIKRKKELLDKVGYLDPQYEVQKRKELSDDIADMKKNGIAYSRYEAEQLKQIEISKYEAILNSTDDFGEAMDAKWKLIGLQAKSAAQVWADAFEGAVQQLEGTLSDFFNDFFNGESKSISEYANSFARGLSREMANALSKNVVSSIFKPNEGGGILGWFGGIFGVGGKKKTEGGGDTPQEAARNFTDTLNDSSEKIQTSSDGFLGAIQKMIGGIWGFIQNLLSMVTGSGGVQSFGGGGGSMWETLGLGALGALTGSGGGGGGGSSMTQGGMQGSSMADFPSSDFSGAYSNFGSNFSYLESARGNIFRNGKILPFRKGGVVSDIAYFPMANGGIGSMAEDGPEAIMPLARTSRGKLGVVPAGGGSSSLNVSVPITINGEKNKKMTAELRSEIQKVVVKVVGGYM